MISTEWILKALSGLKCPWEGEEKWFTRPRTGAGVWSKTPVSSKIKEKIINLNRCCCHFDPDWKENGLRWGERGLEGSKAPNHPGMIGMGKEPGVLEVYLTPGLGKKKANPFPPIGTIRLGRRGKNGGSQPRAAIMQAQTRTCHGGQVGGEETGRSDAAPGREKWH